MIRVAGEERPGGVLTRHFFGGLFDLGFLSEAAALSFGRMILGICTAFFSLGLLLLRIYALRYPNLWSSPDPEPYREALVADHAFALGVPMWIVAFVTILVSHALFPDETDFRVLMALPITRAVVFAAKLAAVALFAGLFAAAGHAALAPVFLLTTVGPWAEHSVPAQAAAFGSASVLASGFSLLLVVAIQGVMTLWMPRGWMLAWSATMRSVLTGLMVTAIPLLFRLPGEGRALRDGDAWLIAVPPAWFVGLERWLLGAREPHFAVLAATGVAALAAVSATATLTYALLYRRFDRVALRPAASRGARLQRWGATRADLCSTRRPVFRAVRSFAYLTLRRSILHQGILVVLFSIGLGLALNSLLMSELPAWLRDSGPATRRLQLSIVWASLAMIFVASLAVRAAIAVPIEQRANWIFRIAAPRRPDEPLRAAVSVVRRLGVWVPVVAIMPLEYAILGSRALTAIAVALLWGHVFVEALMQGWVKIPFTCGYVPGKRFVPQSILVGFLGFTLFTIGGEGLTWLVLTLKSGRWVPIGLLCAVLLILRRRRRQRWAIAPIAFDDDVPDELSPLRLKTD